MHQALLELRGDRLVGEHAAGGGAALAGGADRAEHDGRDRQIQVRGLIDDDRVVAAEFEQALAQARGDALADLAADFGGAGEGDQGHAAVVHEARGELGAEVDEQLEDRRELVLDSSPCCTGVCTASAVSGVLGEGFHTQALPQMAPRKAFQDHTATGKLKAEMMPTTPSGCHCSDMRCCGRSECMVRP